MTDPIADMLTRIRNANTAKHDTVDIPASKMKEAIANILLEEGYVKAVDIIEEGSAEPGVDFCKRLADAGCTAIIYTDIACDGAMQGTNLALYRQLAAEVPGVAFTASGGISSEAELLELKKMGTAAAILGKSLYTGALDLKRCVELVRN